MVSARAAVIRDVNQSWSIEDIEVSEPGPGEVLIKVMASGLCHSDDHIVKGDIAVKLPQVGGHEGAGLVVAVGAGVTRVKVGDKACTLFIPACGKCTYCASGRSYICNNGAGMDTGFAIDGTARFHLADGTGIGGSCRVGSFSTYLVCHESQAIPVPEWIDYETACLVSCGVPTGWGAAVNAAKVKPGDVVLVMGVGGIGMNALQGAKHAGADHILAIDPVEFKRTESFKFGATEAFASIAEASERIAHLTNGQGVDAAIVSVGRVDGDIIGEAFEATGKDGICVVVSIGSSETRIAANPRQLSNLTKTLTGALYGNCNPAADVPRLLKMYTDGRLLIDELVTQRYKLDEINEAYADLHAGVNLRGIIVHDH